MLRLVFVSLLLLSSVVGFSQLAQNSLDDDDALDAMDDSLQASPLYQTKEAQRLLVSSLVLDGVGAGLLVYESVYLGSADANVKLMTDVGIAMTLGASVLCKVVSIGKLLKIREGLSSKTSTDLKISPNGAQMTFSYRF